MQIAPEPLGLAVPGVPGFQLTVLPAISEERLLAANLSRTCSSLLLSVFCNSDTLRILPFFFYNLAFSSVRLPVPLLRLFKLR